MHFFKKIYHLVQETLFWAFSLNWFYKENFYKSWKSINTLNFVVFLIIKIPYYLALYTYIYFIRGVVFRVVYFIFISICYLLNFFFIPFFLILLCCILMKIFANVFFAANGEILDLNLKGTVLPLNQNIFSDNKLGPFNMVDSGFDEQIFYSIFNIDFWAELGGNYFSSIFLSGLFDSEQYIEIVPKEFEILEVYEIIINNAPKIVDLYDWFTMVSYSDFYLSKFLRYSVNSREYFDWHYALGLGWVKDREFDIFFSESKLVQLCLIWKYSLVWFIETFWAFDLFFLILKYTVLFVCIYIINPILELCNLNFNYYISLLICISDSGLLELGYSIKLYAITVVDYFFSHLIGTLIKFEKYSIAAHGLDYSQKKLLLSFFDYDTHKEGDFYMSFRIFYLDEYRFYSYKGFFDAYSVMEDRASFVMEGTPFVDKTYNHSIESLRRPVLSYFYDTILSDDYFSQDTFLKTNVISGRYYVPDNIFDHSYELHHSGYLGFYRFSTSHFYYLADMNIESEDYFTYPYKDRLSEITDTGHKELVNIYTLNFWFFFFLSILKILKLYLLAIFNSIFNWFNVKLLLIFFILFGFYRSFFLLYKIDYLNSVKLTYKQLDRSNLLYIPKDLINEETRNISTLWLFSANLYSGFLKFLINNPYLYIFRLKCSIVELGLFIQRILKMLYLIILEKILYIKTYLYLYIFKKNFIFQKGYKELLNFIKFNNIELVYLFIFTSFSFLVKIIYNLLVLFLIILLNYFIYNFFFLILLVIDITQNITIADVYSTYFMLFFIFLNLFSLSFFKKFRESILGFSTPTDEVGLFLALDDEQDVDDWDLFNNMPEAQEDALLTGNDFGLVEDQNSISKDAGVFITDKGSSSIEYLLLKRFDVFYNSTNANSPILASKLYIEHPIQLLIYMSIPGKKTKSYYSFLFFNTLNNFFIHNFHDLSLSHIASLDTYDDENDQEAAYMGSYVIPSYLKDCFAMTELSLPELEHFEKNEWYNDYVSENIYNHSMYDNNYQFFTVRSKLSEIFILQTDNFFSNYKNIKKLHSFKKIGDFTQFRFIYHPTDLDFDYDELLDIDFMDVLQNNYIGFQLNYSLGIDEITKKNTYILLYNPYECYDNKYKRRFYENLNYYRIVLNLSFFPYVTHYEHKKLLYYFNCTEEMWNSVEKTPQKVKINYPFYEFPIFLFISFNFFLCQNVHFPHGTLKHHIEQIFSFGTRHKFIYDEPLLDSTEFIENCFFYVNSFIEQLLLILSLPGYLHENCWRFSKIIFTVLYAFCYVIPENWLSAYLYSNTIFYNDMVVFIFNLWLFSCRLILGYGLYDLVYFIF